MINFQYDAMIDAMDGPTFQHCVELLWPVLGYRYLQQTDVRRVDLKERIAEVTGNEGMAPGPFMPKNERGTMDRYVDILRFYFDSEYLHVVPGSAAEKYAQRARSIMKEYGRSQEPLTDMEDLFAIYLGLSRAAWPDYQNRKPTSIREMTFRVSAGDEPLMNRLRLYPFSNKTAPGFVRAMMGDSKQPDSEKNYAYLNNVLLYCGLMQAQGDFEEGKE